MLEWEHSPTLYIQCEAGSGGPWGHQDPEGRALVPATLQLPLHGEGEEAAGPGERLVWEWGCSRASPSTPWPSPSQPVGSGPNPSPLPS